MRRSSRFLSVCIALLLLGLLSAPFWFAYRSAHADPAVLYAAPFARGSGDCSSWANACTLQTALSNAISGDEIWVRQGVYYPGAARSDSFTLKSGVAIYGGFAGTETQRDQRDWQTNRTILSGDIDQNDLNADGNFIAETWNDIQGANSFHVIIGSGVDNFSVLDGFVITAGQANGADADSRGGGMYNHSGSPVLANLVFSGNFANSQGGGMYNYSGSPALTDLVFSGNSSASEGGGIYNNFNSGPALTRVTFQNNRAASGGGMVNVANSNPTLVNVVFSSNSADYGGGMYNDRSRPTLTEVVFDGNTASYRGGGLHNIDSASTLTQVTFTGNISGLIGGGMYLSKSVTFSGVVTLTDCEFIGNQATQFHGGGIFNSGNRMTLTNVTFIANTAGGGGGGMRNYAEASPTLVNVVFQGNTALDGGGMSNVWASSPQVTNAVFIENTASRGGAIFNSLYASNPTLTNVTFSRNQASQGGAIFNDDNGNPILTNAILWEDSLPEIVNNTNSSATVTYSIVQGGWPGVGNLDADPRFVDPANDNLRLQSDSPALDAGNNSALPPGVVTDMDGNPRIFNAVIDMGAYEYVQPRPFDKLSPSDGYSSSSFTLSMNLAWSPSIGATSYEVCYDTTDNDNCDASWISTPLTSTVISGLSSKTTNYWQERAGNDFGNR